MKKLFPLLFLTLVLCVSGCTGIGEGESEDSAGKIGSDKSTFPTYANSTGDVAIVSWDLVKNSSQDIAVLRAGADKKWSEIALVDPDNVYFLDSGLAKGSYSYKIRVTDAEGVAVDSDPVSVEIGVGVGVRPSKPNSVKLLLTSQNTIRVWWHDTSANETGFVVKYEPHRFSSSLPPDWKTVLLPANSTQFDLTELSSDTFYDITIKAVNGSNESGETDILTIQTRHAPNSVETKYVDTTDPPSAPPSGYWVTNTYDEYGYLIKKEIDNEGDGVMDEVTTYDSALRDEFGNIIQPNVSRTYNQYGDILTVTRDGALTYNATYDDFGNKLTESAINPATGNAYWTYSWTYDSNGSLLQYSYDGDNDGNVGTRHLYAYDAFLNLIKYETLYDDNDDGTVDYFNLTYYAEKTFDPYGNAIFGVEDYPESDVPETVWIAAPFGDEEREIGYYDRDEDGVFDGLEFETYNSDGKMTAMVDDDNNDGYYEDATYWTYVDGIVTESKYFDQDSDGVLDSSEITVSDEATNKDISISKDRDGDGEIDYYEKFILYWGFGI